MNALTAGIHFLAVVPESVRVAGIGFACGACLIVMRVHHANWIIWTPDAVSVANDGKASAT